MPHVDVYVSPKELLDDLDNDEICEYLVKQEGWREALDEAVKGKSAVPLTTLQEDMQELIEAHSRGSDISWNLQSIADRHFGKVI